MFNLWNYLVQMGTIKNQSTTEIASESMARVPCEEEKLAISLEPFLTFECLTQNII